MIKYETDGEIALFTIENGKVNPFNPAMHKQLHDLLLDFERDPAVKVGILTGAGDRAFCAGDDIKTPRAALTAGESVDRHLGRVDPEADLGYPGWEREVHRMRRFKPIVAATKGWCVGQGMFYLLRLTDLRVAGESSKFGLPEIAWEMAGASGFAAIYRHLPRAVAMQLVLTGDPIDAQEAYRVGLVNMVVPDAEVLEKARFLAGRIARHPARAIRVEMESFLRGEQTDDETAYALTDHLYRLQRLGSGQNAWDVDFQKKGVKG